MPRHDRGGGASRVAPHRRAQPQLRCPGPTDARAYRERRVRAREDDHRAEFHRLPLPPAPARGAGYRPGRRRRVQPGRPPGRHRPAARRRPGRDRESAHAARGIRRGPPRARIHVCSRFEDGAFASLAYSGYAHFDSDEWCNWIGELGQKKDPDAYGGARKLLLDGDEAALKSSRNYGGRDYSPRRLFLPPALRRLRRLLRPGRSASAARGRHDLRRRRAASRSATRAAHAARRGDRRAL